MPPKRGGGVCPSPPPPNSYSTALVLVGLLFQPSHSKPNKWLSNTISIVLSIDDNIQEFVGMANFYHRLIPATTQLISPLFGALEAQNTLEWYKESIGRGYFP